MKLALSRLGSLSLGPLLTISFGLFCSAAWSVTIGNTIQGDIRADPSNLPSPNAGGQRNPFKFEFACYDITNFNLLACPFFFQVHGLKDPMTDPDNNGGHNHYDNRPLIYRTVNMATNPPTVTDDMLTCEDPSQCNNQASYDVTAPIIGNTKSSTAIIDYNMPEVDGNIVTESIIDSPPGYICLSDCYTITANRFLDTVHVAIKETLVELPPSSFYIRCGLTAPCVSDATGVDNNHPQPHFGNPELIGKVIGLATMYRSRYPAGPTGQMLRISDISLTNGGLLDTTTSKRSIYWTPPHQSHRLGTSVDISRYALTDNGETVFVDQEQLDKMATRVGLRLHSETSSNECPDIASGPPCIHYDL